MTICPKVAQVVGGGTPKSTEAFNFSTKGIPWITPADLSSFTDVWIERGGRCLTEAGYDSCSARLVPRGTVLMSSRAPIGYLAIAANELCTNQGFKSFVLPKELDPRFVYYWLKSIREEIEHMGSGSTFLEVSGSRCGEIPLVVAPHAEQTRIVTKVDALLAPVKAARQRLAKVPAILKRFRQSVLAAACSGRLTADWREKQNLLEPASQLVLRIGELRRERHEYASKEAKNVGEAKVRDYDNYHPNVREDLALNELPNEWAWVDLRFLMDEGEAFCYGVVQPEKDDPSGVFLIRAGDLNDGTVNMTVLRRIPREVDADYARSRVGGGELLVTVVGAGIGRVAIVPDSCAGFNIARAIAKVPIRDFSREYVFHWLNSGTALAWLRGDSREVARPTLNLEQLKTLPVPLPPMIEQHEIVRRVEALFKLADAIEKRLAAATARAEKLTQAILAKAFRGELVLTEAQLARKEGRDYEPASVLLERIRIEQNQRAHAKKK
jgi:type I restriction enzyme S subunit